MFRPLYGVRIIFRVYFTVYEIIPGFIVSLALIFIVSLATKAPSKEVIEEFESVKTADV